MSPNIVVGYGIVTYGPVEFKFNPDHCDLEAIKKISRLRVAVIEEQPDNTLLNTGDYIGKFRDWFKSRQDG